MPSRAEILGLSVVFPYDVTEHVRQIMRSNLVSLFRCLGWAVVL